MTKYTENKNFKQTDTIVSSGKVVGVEGNVTIKNVQKVNVTKDGVTKTFYNAPGNVVKDKDGKYVEYPYAMPITKEGREAFNAAAAASTVRKVTSEKRPQLEGYLDVTVPANDFSIMVSIMKSKEGNLFVATPSRKGTDKDGNTKYYTDIVLSDEQKKAILDAYSASKAEPAPVAAADSYSEDPMA